MRTILLLFCFFLYFNGSAQSYLGKTREEITRLAGEDFKDAELIYTASPERPYLQLQNGYETLYYYLKNNVCVEFVVVKPYSCNCLETDFQAYQDNCIALGPFKWVSKDYSNVYQMSMQKTTYSLSITPNTSKRLVSRSQ